MIPFVNLQAQYKILANRINESIKQVLDSSDYILGSQVSTLEERLAKYLNVGYALSCSSGTDALLMILMTKKLVKGDAVFTSPFTFFASSEVITLAGGTPVFVDIDENTYNLNPVFLERKIEQVCLDNFFQPKGIIPVDLFGIAADYNRINKIAKDHNLFVLEDAAQSFGADYHGKRAGNLADIAATSFYPAKPLGCYGDGGAVFTNDSELYEKLVSLRVHGQATNGDKYDNVRIGLNARMDTIQAAILLEKLKIYDDEREARNRVAAAYTERLKDVVQTPIVPDGQTSVWAQYSVQASNRDEVRMALQEQGIPTAVFYPIPIHLSTAYKHLGYKQGDFPVAEAVSKRIFSLPMHPYLEEPQIDQICEVITKVARR